MTIYDQYHQKYPEFENKEFKAKTEKAVCYALKEAGYNHNEVFGTHIKIDGIPFNKGGQHEVDFRLVSSKGEELFVEVKGEMTLLEINKLQYLLNETSYNFYVLQLTEIDWIEPYNKEKSHSKAVKSEHDFKKQMDELICFVKGEKSGKELSDESKKRLKDYIEFRAKELETWISRKGQTRNSPPGR